MTLPDQAKLLLVRGCLVLIGSMLSMAIFALGCGTQWAIDHNAPSFNQVCAAAYVGQVAYWTEDNDGRMHCNRSDIRQTTSIHR